MKTWATVETLVKALWLLLAVAVGLTLSTVKTQAVVTRLPAGSLAVRVSCSKPSLSAAPV